LKQFENVRSRLNDQMGQKPANYDVAGKEYGDHYKQRLGY